MPMTRDAVPVEQRAAHETCWQMSGSLLRHKFDMRIRDRVQFRNVNFWCACLVVTISRPQQLSQ